MKEIKVNHYIETVIYSIDKAIHNLKSELKQKIESLNLDITSEQFVVLDAICCYPNIYQQKLSEIIMKDKSNTTRMLKILEDKALIQKQSGKLNNRLVYFLNVTKKGENIVKTTMPKIKKFIQEVFENITDEDVETLHLLSNKAHKEMSKFL